MYHVPRTCTEKKMDDGVESRPITDFRERAAYVLLGEPGAGKSTLFKEEADNTDNGFYISARDFIDLDRNEWRDKILFIDGLDEARAGKGDARTPLGAIRGKLSQLDCQCFRISCREADWLGSPDAKDLAGISPNRAITILHLNPLSSDDIKQILSNDQRVPDPNGFIEQAEQVGLSGLLNNPQTLDMLIDATKGGDDWPSSKQQVYELACKQLASEFNDDHAVSQTATIPQLIEAAGFLCAVQLIANISGFTKGQTGEGRLSLKDLTIPNDLPIHAALKTRLFSKTGNNEFSYVHRSVAEYLAAQFIARKIKQGLLVNRVLALTSGFDGGIVAALRGLMAWLSVHSEQARERLIEIDPMGIVAYGDTQFFSTTNKLKLLDALRQEAEKTDYLRQEWSAQAFAAITTKDMMPHILALMTSPSRKNSEQSVINCLLDGLCNSETIPELKQALIAVVRDSSYWEGIRVGALQAFLHQYPNDTESLLELADDICQGKISDNNRLLGLLLNELFPKSIPASKIFQYLKPAGNEHIISYYEVFWSHKFIERLRDEDLIIVLDELAIRGDKFLKTITFQHSFLSMVGSLLVRGLQVYGENISLEKLYNWLSIGFDKHSYRVEPEYRKQISDWLGNHPNTYLGLLETGISLINNFENPSVGVSKIFLIQLRHAVPPDNVGLWWLEQISSSPNHSLSCEFFRQAFMTLVNERGHYGLSLEYFENWLVTHPEFNETYCSLIMNPIEDWYYEHAESDKKWEKQRKDQLKTRLKYFIQHKSDIAEGSAHPQAYHELAAAYFHHHHDINGNTGAERLSDFLNDNVELIDAANSGLRTIISRTDLPELDEIFALAIKNREHYIRLPFLVCMEKLYQENPSVIASLTDNLVSKALAFWYTYGAGDEPAWVKPISLLNESLTAQVFIAYVSAMLAGKKQHIHGLYQLVHDDDYQKIASLVVIPLLNKYPVRGTIQLTSNLEYLLKAAIKYMPKNELLPVIENKLGHKGMDVAQRVYWLITGLFIEPEAYETSIKKEVSGNTTRINHLSTFLCPRWPVNGNNYEVSASMMGMLIEILGPRCSPHREARAHWVGQAENERDFVYYLLNQLGNTPSEDSTSALGHLRMLPQLSAWHDQIQSSQQTQQLSRREVLFKHPNAVQVINTLSNLKPANVADLAALTVDCLEQLSEKMHGSSTDSYEHFWNVDSRYGKPETPRPENNCRNYLLEQLEPLLAKFDVQIELEAHQAKDKRADMKISFISGGKTFHLPVEIKRDYHKDLWRAIHNQLIPFYTIAPETEGRGLFLVIWFNHKKLPTHPQGLPPPKSAEQLAAMLKDTMTPQEQKLIDVFVLDVSKK